MPFSKFSVSVAAVLATACIQDGTARATQAEFDIQKAKQIARENGLYKRARRSKESRVDISDCP